MAVVAFVVARQAVVALTSTSSRRRPGLGAAVFTTFTPSDGRFTAEFPTTPERRDQSIERPGLSLKVTIFLAGTNNEEVAVGYANLPIALSADALQRALDGGVDGSAADVHGT